MIQYYKFFGLMDIKEELRIKKFTLHYENGELFLKATVR